ncbi:MAG: anti-sigma factor [Actinomycetota bacterium]|nr:anti-sigma factor [Actinomycetota bacterium]
MDADHDRIEELLAGYVLRSLSGDDAREADRLLSEHVPSCPACRATLNEFQALMGEMALSAEPLAPPEMLLPRLHREMGAPTPRRRPVAAMAAAGAIVVVVGMTGLAVSQGIRASNADRQSALMGEALRVASRPDASQVPMVGNGASGASGAPVEISAPGVEVVYLVCNDVAPPAAGMVYRVWFGQGTSFRFVRAFEPEADVTVLRLEFDPSTIDRIVITEEPSDLAPTQPDLSAIRWSDAA